jgi:antitoxin component YwqK of YwqJK toxin-antitoxin module
MRNFLFLSLLFAAQISQAQNKYKASDIIDERYGITMYNNLIRMAGGDSVRNCDGSPCHGYVSDFYLDNKLMHKGYYVDGMIRIFKNFWKNGKVERKFTILDDHKAKLKVFYESGAAKSEVYYMDGDVREWRDYYENGNIEFEEKYVKAHDHIEYRRFFYDSGEESNIIEFEKKGKKLYRQTLSYPNGKVKEEGSLVYSDTSFDYMKIGDWKRYDETGKLLKTVSYVMGTITHTENH